MDDDDEEVEEVEEVVTEPETEPEDAILDAECPCAATIPTCYRVVAS